MSITLPSTPGIKAASPSLLDFGGVLVPPGGGVAQQLIRPGKFSIEVSLPSARSTAEGATFVSRLIRAKSQGALYAFPQDMNVGSPGSAIVVNGGGQTGSSINLRGLQVGYATKEGQFFSIIYAGRRYLHEIDAVVVADGSGHATLPISPILRISPNDGAVCEFIQPMIEGYVSGNAVQWQIQTAPYVDISFSIIEMA